VSGQRDDADLIAAGRAAFGDADWHTAYDCLVRADAIEPLTPVDLDRLAQAAMWVGEHEQCIAYGQRAFTAWEAADDRCRAADAAMRLCRDHVSRGRAAVAGGWYEQARRLLDGVDECPELAQLASLEGSIALFLRRDVEGADRNYTRALDIARSVGDRSVEAMQLVLLGTVKVRKGDVSSGFRMVDDAMISALTGALDNVTTAQVYCSTISLCQALGDIRRSYEWTEEAVSCSTNPATGDFPGDCRLHRAEITRLRGDWDEAERELHRLMDTLERWDLTHVGQAWYELGEIALRRGELGEARRHFDRADGYGKAPLPGTAALQLAEGDAVRAAAALTAACLEVGDGDPLEVAQLLPVLIEAQVATGDLAGAQQSLDRLAALDATFGTVVLQAQVAIGAARLALAEGDLDEARSAARRAIVTWRDAGLPYETAQAQHVLAEAARRAGDLAAAIVDLDAAIAVFDGLGASRDLADAQVLRSRLGELPVGRRVRRTFMFTDLVDSTRLVAAMGDERWAGVLRWHDRTIRELLAAHGGVEVKQRGGGDGFFAAFESAADAIDAARSIQRAFAEHRDHAGFAPDIRIGVHQADALLTGNDFAGVGVHEAARIGALAGTAEILASEVTVSAANGADALPPFEAELKGLASPMRVQRVRWN
jgi:class 3 adenylate cyclase